MSSGAIMLEKPRGDSFSDVAGFVLHFILDHAACARRMVPLTEPAKGGLSQRYALPRACDVHGHILASPC